LETVVLKTAVHRVQVEAGESNVIFVSTTANAAIKALVVKCPLRWTPHAPSGI